MNFDIRSTSVTSTLRCPLPITVSTSQSPTRDLAITHSGRSEMSTRFGMQPRPRSRPAVIFGFLPRRAADPPEYTDRSTRCSPKPPRRDANDPLSAPDSRPNPRGLQSRAKAPPSASKAATTPPGDALAPFVPLACDGTPVHRCYDDVPVNSSPGCDSFRGRWHAANTRLPSQREFGIDRHRSGGGSRLASESPYKNSSEIQTNS